MKTLRTKEYFIIRRRIKLKRCAAKRLFIQIISDIPFAGSQRRTPVEIQEAAKASQHKTLKK